NPEGIEQTTQLFNEFLQTKTPKVTTPKELAKRMASLAQLIRDAIATALNEPDQGGMLREQLESFQKVLIRDLTKVQFADMYAQTICYGLFAARCNTNNLDNFSRENAAFRLPKTNPFLRSIFGQIAGPDLDDRITWAVDTLATILQQTDMAEILKDFGKRTRREDPVVHFYETFLAAYDPKMRESRGVYYTPEPVVSYIVNSVDYILKNKFNIAKGLADSKKIKIPNPKGEGTIDSHQVLILDPAVGTGTFMHSVINHIYDNFKAQKGMWSSYVTQHLLPRLFGFELLMAPYTVAHMKLGLQLQELGYDFNSDERLRIYLTNTLEEAFQCVPLTSNPELFWKLTQKGDRLVNLHLIKETAQEITTYPQPGDNNIEKIRYTEPQNQTLGKVWINKTQYFEGVPPEVWNFQVGGYQVCQKWLKDRVGRTLDYDDLTHYQNIVAALSETILLRQEIDQIIAKNGGFPML
ncbi:MAG: type ISP restriction/modification enzyme, partial [Planktothrix sp.]